MKNNPVCPVIQPSNNGEAQCEYPDDGMVRKTGYDHQRIAERLEDLVIELRSITDRSVEAIPTSATLMAMAGKIYSARRSVNDVFGVEGFSVSPAWDMLLDLYQARLRGKRISVTSACIGGACPATTGLRWLQVLEASNLVVREPDPEDRRRHVVALTDGAMVKVEIALKAYL